jgi:hypothetical protein
LAIEERLALAERDGDDEYDWEEEEETDEEDDFVDERSEERWTPREAWIANYD